MDIIKVAESLHPLERKVVPCLGQYTDFNDIVKHSKLSQTEAMRAVQWLENKKIISIEQKKVDVIDLDGNGKSYQKSGLPEINLLKILEDKPMPISSAISKAKIKKDEMSICLGELRKKGAINISKGKEMMLEITQAGKKLREKPTLNEQFLSLSFPLQLDSLKPEQRHSYMDLSKRKAILITQTHKQRTIKLTKEGKELIKLKIDDDVIDALTSEMLKTGSWKNKKFRRFDVEINVPAITGGRRHFVNQATDTARQIWLSMGFKEMTGPYIQTGFWNFDALFTAQDHPVRDMQDTFYIGNPKEGKLPQDKKLLDSVKNAHEKGVGGATGWQYTWEQGNAKTNVLRTHTTCLSAKTLAHLKKEDIPAKFFALGRCFRNETMDWSHLFEFNQTEGIVVDPQANFRHLIGYLKQFFTKMGFPKARFRPAYFPYTELSLEIDVYHEGRHQWIELGGAGIFRPEVVIPLLGKDIPVLAWGPGFDRIILEYFNISDIRELYHNDIKQLREIKVWLKDAKS